MFTRDYWLGDNGVLVRAVRTWAQTAIAVIGVGTTDLFSADIKNVLALSTSAAILSVLMSLDRREALLTEPPVKHDEVLNFSEPAAFASSPMGCGSGLMR